MQGWGLGRWPGARIQTDLCVGRGSLGQRYEEVSQDCVRQSKVAASGGT